MSNMNFEKEAFAAILTNWISRKKSTFLLDIHKSTKCYIESDDDFIDYMIELHKQEYISISVRCWAKPGSRWREWESKLNICQR